MNVKHDCVKCGSSMNPGVTIDQGHGTAHVSTWQAGEPKKSIWFGLKQSKADQHEIVTWRCASCGYLESYAD
jgi:predicted nucleic-acid-binding Zn-ribbon protein